MWSSDPRLTLPSPTRLTEAQTLDLLAAITCPLLAIHSRVDHVIPPANGHQIVDRVGSNDPSQFLLR